MDKQIKDLKLEDILSVYVGKPGKCCCGCSGNHYYASQHIERSNKSHGYDCSDRINDAKVKRVFNKAIKMFDPEDKIIDTYIDVEIGKTLYILYLE